MFSQPLQHICLRPDALRKTNGLSAVNADVINIAVRDEKYWRILAQIIKICKPLVDVIGNLESRDANLADCMLELIWCARDMFRIQLEPEDDIGFWTHAKAVFNREFHSMNTGLHNLALFLHPLCRKLAISQAAKGRSFDAVCGTALEIARQWRWDQAKAGRLLEDLKQYYHRKGPFAGSSTDGLDWWENLEIPGKKHPLKGFAITILSIVPHSAEVERLFSDLNGVQGVKHCNFNVDTFENLGKLRANYAYHIHQRLQSSGKSGRRRHGHMHTRENGGINVDLATDIADNFTWTPPLSTGQPEVSLEGPESITDAELDAAFDEIETRNAERPSVDPTIEGVDIEAGKAYDFEEFERVDKGVVPEAFEDKVEVISSSSGAVNWDIASLLHSKGISSA